MNPASFQTLEAICYCDDGSVIFISFLFASLASALSTSCLRWLKSQRYFEETEIYFPSHSVRLNQSPYPLADPWTVGGKADSDSSLLGKRGSTTSVSRLLNCVTSGSRRRCCDDAAQLPSDQLIDLKKRESAVFSAWVTHRQRLYKNIFQPRKTPPGETGWYFQVNWKLEHLVSQG